MTTLPKPDWQTADGRIQLFNRDCMEVLPLLPKASISAIVTDPPYGIDYGRAGGFSALHGWGPWRENVAWDCERPSVVVFETILGFEVPTLIWGGNYFTDMLPPSMGWVSWDKGQRDFSLADFELAWTSEQKAARCIVYPRGSAIRDGKVHPTQKPLEIMEQCIAYLDRGRKKQLATILDPFLGSGTTLIAAARMGRRGIGIEREQKYFEAAIERIEAELNRAPLFEPPPVVQRSYLEETT